MMNRRRHLHETVRLITEELQGATVVPNANAANAALPTPAAGKAGKPAQAVAGAVQATANQAAAGANANAAAGDQAIRDQMATQQGQTPSNAQHTANAAAAQPQPARVNPTAMARARRTTNLQQRSQAMAGTPAPVAVEAVIPEDTVDDKSAANDAHSPDDKPDLNKDAAKNRPGERAKEVFSQASNEKKDNFPGKRSDPKAAGYGKNGAGRRQGHHEMTQFGQRAKRSTEKPEGGEGQDKTEKEDDSVSEAHKNILDGVFGD